jgi:GT2 family glycosyltransferase
VTATNGTPRLTLGLPTNLGEEFLAESMDALLAHTFTDFELIISDNGSTDRTAADAMDRGGGREPEAFAPVLVFAHPAPTQAKPKPRGHWRSSRAALGPRRPIKRSNQTAEIPDQVDAWYG